jgi:hypothetical protein
MTSLEFPRLGLMESGHQSIIMQTCEAKDFLALAAQDGCCRCLGEGDDAFDR